jgi:hypothetical protein
MFKLFFVVLFVSFELTFATCLIIKELHKIQNDDAYFLVLFFVFILILNAITILVTYLTECIKDVLGKP